MKLTANFIKVFLIIIFSGCLFDMPYGYFQLVRFLGMVGFGILAYAAYQQEQKNLALLWVVSAALINPIVKIALGRMVWNIVDIIWVVVLLISLVVENKERFKKETK